MNRLAAHTSRRFRVTLFVLLGGALLFCGAMAARAQEIDTSQAAKLRAIDRVMSDSPSIGPSGIGQQAAPARAVKTASLSVTQLLFRVTGGLVLTAIMIFLLSWTIRKLGLVGRSRMTGGSMDFLEALPLGQNRGLVLVRVLDKVYLLSQAPDGVSKLETFEGEKALEMISSSKGGVSMTQFKDVFNSFMKRGRKSA
jgi:flagellar biogenesis protein FliO